MIKFYESMNKGDIYCLDKFPSELGVVFTRKYSVFRTFAGYKLERRLRKEPHPLTNSLEDVRIYVGGEHCVEITYREAFSNGFPPHYLSPTDLVRLRNAD